MADLKEVLSLARQLRAEEQAQLARELAPAGSGGALTQLASLAARPPAPQSVAWVKAERGHAVLATDSGPGDAEIPPGPAAVAGMWADMGGSPS